MAWHGTTSGIHPTWRHVSSTHVGCRSTRLQCFGSCTGYMRPPRSESNFRSCALAAGMPLCARQSTGVSDWQPAADIRGCCLSPSALCRLSDDAGAVNPSINSRWPRVSCGCSASVEQSATTDQGRLLAINMSAVVGRGALKMREWKMQEWKIQERKRMESRQSRK